ncbi:hypothetical protein [Myceligenerans xiligouense]|uniref:DUF3618 domain-containing protein n=1 Tax=Myceligenerans xiligouense TaxID=253184 RepID=A0A3N4ZI48_9MICO|nr:hypothetical protein [Myceligenerans xiligouense]RPF20545.1 hypothetical protein EDD34_1141 [Myceligenerans xiligouense]
MSTTGTPYDGGSGSQFSPTSGSGTTETGAGSTKERLTDTAAQAADASRSMANDAKEKVRDVAHEAAQQTHGLLDRTRSELSSQARSQQQRLADGLHTMEDELGQMASASEDPGYTSNLVRRAGDASGQAARWLEDREPGAILGEIENFARRRPGIFIALSAGAGLLVGRFLRGMKDADDTSDNSPGGASAEPATVAVPGERGTPARTTAGAVPPVPGATPSAEPQTPPPPESGSVRPTIPPPVPPPAPGVTQQGGGTHV